MILLKYFNIALAVLFVICFSYQFIYVVVSLFRRKRKIAPDAEPKDYAVLICARNEKNVIGDLIDSLHGQDYPQEKLSVFVLADNCTDNTAEIAREKGAIVYERQNKQLVGKGYALHELLKHIQNDFPQSFDGYFIFDADNLLAPDYIAKMNNTFSEGHDIVTGFRNSKNFCDNWVSAGYALSFMRENSILNLPRFMLGTSCAVSGTGFMFSRKIAEELDGWPYHLLTEDLEFTTDQILKDRKIAFCYEAELYDEQPTSFSQSWRQRLRWTKGYLQVFGRYCGGLFKGALHGKFSCFDMLMINVPAYVLSGLSLVLGIALVVTNALNGSEKWDWVMPMAQLVSNVYLTMLGLGALSAFLEYKRIHGNLIKTCLYLITFPVFMLTYLPISLCALFSTKVEWKPVEHKVTAEQLRLNEEKGKNK